MIFGILDELEFTAAERERALRSALAAPSLVTAMTLAARPSELRDALRAHTPEAIALAGALAQESSPSAADAAREWFEHVRHVRLRINGDDLLAAGVAPRAGDRAQADARARAQARRRAARRARRGAAGGARGHGRGLMAQVDRDIGASVDELVFDLPGGGRALFTDRSTGNLSMRAGEDHERGLQRRHELCESLGLRWLCASPQVHGTDVQRVLDLTGSRGHPAPIDADGHATALPGVGDDGARRRLPAGRARLRRARWRWSTPAGGGSPRACSRRACARCASSAAATTRSSPSSAPAPGSAATRSARRCTARSATPTATGATSTCRRSPATACAAPAWRTCATVGACTICDERFFSHRREGQRAGRQAGIAWLS